jgi:F-type H+-transporting ATPase subunit epsilon
MQFQLITLTGVKYGGDAYSVILPTMAGEITVMPDHEPLMTALKPGVISIRRKANDPESEVEDYATYGGVAEVTSEGVRVLVDEADNDDEINEQEALNAQEAARQHLVSAKSQTDLDHAQAVIDRQAVRLQVADLRRRRTRQR